MTAVPLAVPPVAYSGSVTPPALNVTVPDGGPFDAAYKAAGWTPPTPPAPAPTPAPPAMLAVRGMTIPAWYLTTYSDGTGFSSLLPDLAADGVTHIIINPYPQFTSAANPTLAASNQTATVASMEAAIAAIHAAGMKAAFKCTASFLDGTNAETYPGTNNDNGAAFLTSYTALLVTYAQMCQTAGVTHMEVCYEMDTLAQANPAGFRNLIAAVRETFKGTISYGATSWYFNKITFWDACDYIGVHAWFDLVPPSQAGTSNLNVAAMVAYLSTGTQSNGRPTPIPTMAALSAQYNKKVLLTEVGYLSILGCAYQPYASARAQTGTTSQPDQAAAIQATLEAYTPQPWCEGLFYWTWDVIGKTEAASVNDYTPHFKTGETVLKAAWT